LWVQYCFEWQPQVKVLPRPGLSPTPEPSLMSWQRVSRFSESCQTLRDGTARAAGRILTSILLTSFADKLGGRTPGGATRRAFLPPDLPLSILQEGRKEIAKRTVKSA